MYNGELFYTNVLVKDIEKICGKIHYYLLNLIELQKYSVDLR